jgi:hypothetical protein
MTARDDVRIVQYEARHLEDVLELLGGQQFKQRLWSWQFRTRDNESCSPLVAETAAGEVVGFNGCMPVAVKLGERRATAIWSCDFHVHKRYRGTGIGKEIKRKLQASHPLILALGISGVASHVHASSGWRRNRDALSYVYLGEGWAFKVLIKRAIQATQRLVRFFHRHTDPELTIRICDATDIPHDIDKLWARSEASYANVVVRDRAYLTWRYAQHPLVRYRLIIVKRGDSLEAVGVYWADDSAAALVDYIGPSSAPVLKRAVVSAFFDANAHAGRLNCLTTDDELQRELRNFGFNAWRSRAVRFSVYSDPSYGEQPHEDWFLTGGDSDGDILEAARAADRLVVERWSEDEMESREQQWRALHERSSADPLFLSWDWQWTWWRAFAKAHRLEGYWLAARRPDGELVGIAPMFKDRTRHLGFGSRRLHFIGNIWRGPRTMRSEYLEFIVDRARADEAVDALLDHIASDPDWDEFILSDLDDKSVAAARLACHPIMKRAHRRVIDRFTGYTVDTRGTFADYVATLDSSARRKLLNLRSRLQSLGEVRIEYAAPGQFRVFAERLDRLHACRWGRRFFEGGHRAFHYMLADALDQRDALQFSILTVGGRDASALYNIRSRGHEYNLQGGFDESVAPGLPLGILHLGYAMERTFADGLVSFELLIGGGKHRDFKRNFAKRIRQVTGLQLLRSPRLAWPYRLYDRLRGARARRGKHSSPPGPTDAEIS